VKSREGLPGMIPTNILKNYVVEKQEPTQTHGSDIMSKFNKMNITLTSLKHKKSFNS